MQLGEQTIAAVIFDLDGTLLDSEKYHIRAFAAAVGEQTGYNLTDRPADQPATVLHLSIGHPF